MASSLLLLFSSPSPPTRQPLLVSCDRFSSSLSYHTLLYRQNCNRRRRTVRSMGVDQTSMRSSSKEDNKNERRAGPDLGTLSRRFWKVAGPYWFSDDKVQARLRLAVVFALTLGTTGISVGFNFLGRDFYNALANKDQEQFTRQLLYYLGAFAGGIPVFVLRDYARETLSLRWRSWMTSYYMDRYLQNQTFYKIQSQSLIDNPDQRIVDDLNSFTGTALAFSLTLFNAVVDLISFSNILYGIYPPLFVVLLVYSIGGTAISVFLGKDLVSLNFMQEKKEADFRYGLVRIRENAESIAFYAGEENELQLLMGRFKMAFDNLSKLLISSRNLEFFTNGYRYLIQILPAAVVAPMYFSGKIEFGVINQSVSAFNHILSDFSLIVYQFQALSAFSAVIDRLGEFDAILDGNALGDLASSSYEKISIQYSSKEMPRTLQSNGSPSMGGHQKLLEVKSLRLLTPSTNNILIEDLSFEIQEKEHLLVMGPSGCGKTSLLRALAGLWRTGQGNVTYYTGESALKQFCVSQDAALESTNPATPGDINGITNKRGRGIFFLPQKPYMVLGSLRQQLLYPTWWDNSFNELQSNKLKSSLPILSQLLSLEDKQLKRPTSDDLIHSLEAVCLSDILYRYGGLDAIHDWSSVLSLGEQQRLAFARLLLSKPKLALLDESTSALDTANEAHLYRQIEAAGITFISIGHRRTLCNYHNRVLHVSKFEPEKHNGRNWVLDSIAHTTSNEEPKATF